jgi:tetratricopeptide (TPR) repeat protein
VAALWQALAALREAEFGETKEARHDAERALALAPGRNVKVFAGLALARIGAMTQAQHLADDLEKENASNTVLRLHRLPTLRAAIELRRGNPEKTITLLEITKPYEFGQPSPVPLGTLYPPYLRGLAFLARHDGVAATVEFQKILDHPGIALNFPVGVLAHLQIGRAYAMLGDTAKARAAYRDFLTLWKDADPDIPILKQAKAQYAKLQ